MFYWKRIKAFYNLSKGAPSIFADPLTGLAALTIITIPAFWSLTSQSLLPYLIPTTPLLAIFVAVRFNDIGELNTPYRCFSTKLFILICAIGFTAGTAIVSEAVQNRQPNLNSEIYYELQALKQTEQWKETPLYFMEATPYSAEFYLDGLFVVHKPESLEESLNRSSQNLLVVSIWNEQDLGVPINRKLLFQSHAWKVYAPEQIQKNNN